MLLPGVETATLLLSNAEKFNKVYSCLHGKGNNMTYDAIKF